jgi:hypothetical protein
MTRSELDREILRLRVLRGTQTRSRLTRVDGRRGQRLVSIPTVPQYSKARRV